MAMYAGLELPIGLHLLLQGQLPKLLTNIIVS